MCCIKRQFWLTSREIPLKLGMYGAESMLSLVRMCSRYVNHSYCLEMTKYFAVVYFGLFIFRQVMLRSPG